MRRPERGPPMGDAAVYTKPGGRVNTNFLHQNAT